MESFEARLCSVLDQELRSLHLEQGVSSRQGMENNLPNNVEVWAPFGRSEIICSSACSLSWFLSAAWCMGVIQLPRPLANLGKMLVRTCASLNKVKCFFYKKTSILGSLTHAFGFAPALSSLSITSVLPSPAAKCSGDTVPFQVDVSFRVALIISRRRSLFLLVFICFDCIVGKRWEICCVTARLCRCGRRWAGWRRSWRPSSRWRSENMRFNANYFPPRNTKRTGGAIFDCVNCRSDFFSRFFSNKALFSAGYGFYTLCPWAHDKMLYWCLYPWTRAILRQWRKTFQCTKLGVAWIDPIRCSFLSRALFYNRAQIW